MEQTMNATTTEPTAATSRSYAEGAEILLRWPSPKGTQAGTPRSGYSEPEHPATITRVYEHPTNGTLYYVLVKDEAFKKRDFKTTAARIRFNPAFKLAQPRPKRVRKN